MEGLKESAVETIERKKRERNGKKSTGDKAKHLADEIKLHKSLLGIRN